MNKTVLAIIIGSVLVGGAILFSGSKNSITTVPSAQADNVSVSDGKQIVAIDAKGGYSPKRSVAKADTPTILRMKTDGTYDCSSAVTIPSIKYEKNLPPSGITDIEIPAQKAGTTLQGLCSMGMQRFEVAFN